MKVELQCLGLLHRYFTWDKHLFPNPAKLQDDVASHGRKTVTIIDPHIKRDPGYYIYQEAEQGHYFVKNKDGADYDGCCPQRPLIASTWQVLLHALGCTAVRLVSCAGGAGQAPRSTWTC